MNEQCMICGAVNYLSGDFQAWECWCCFSPFWLDDETKTEYTIINDVSDAEADKRLLTKHASIIFENGQNEQN